MTNKLPEVGKRVIISFGGRNAGEYKELFFSGFYEIDDLLILWEKGNLCSFKDLFNSPTIDLREGLFNICFIKEDGIWRHQQSNISLFVPEGFKQIDSVSILEELPDHSVGINDKVENNRFTDVGKTIEEAKKLMKFKAKLQKNFISTMTDTRFKIPADTKSQAFIKWLEISVIFDSTIDDILKTRDWREE